MRKISADYFYFTTFALPSKPALNAFFPICRFISSYAFSCKTMYFFVKIRYDRLLHFCSEFLQKGVLFVVLQKNLSVMMNVIRRSRNLSITQFSEELGLSRSYGYHRTYCLAFTNQPFAPALLFLFGRTTGNFPASFTSHPADLRAFLSKTDRISCLISKTTLTDAS